MCKELNYQIETFIFPQGLYNRRRRHGYNLSSSRAEGRGGIKNAKQPVGHSQESIRMNTVPII